MKVVVTVTETCKVAELYKHFFRSYMCIDLDHFLDNNMMLSNFFCAVTISTNSCLNWKCLSLFCQRYTSTAMILLDG